MHCIITDFIHSGETTTGVGFFEGDSLAVSIASQIPKIHKKLFKKYRVVPVRFIDYLKALQILPEDMHISRRERTVGIFIERLLFISDSMDQGTKAIIDFIWKTLYLSEYPDAKRLFPSGEKTWMNMRSIINSSRGRVGMTYKPNKKLKIFLLNKGMTQRQLAFGSQVSESDLSKAIKYGVSSPSLREKVSTYLGVPEKEIFTRI